MSVIRVRGKVMRRFLIALALAAAMLGLNVLLPEEAASQIGYQIRAADITSTSQIFIADGDATNPSLTFTSETNTGLFRPGAFQLGFTAAGSERMRLSNTLDFFNSMVIENEEGTVSVPAYSFFGDTNTGMYQGGADSVGFAAGGNDLGLWKVATGEIANAALKTLNGTPVEVIAGPGSGKAIIIESSRFMLEHATADFDGVVADEDLVVEYSGGLDLQTCDNSTCLDAAASANAFGYVLEPTTALGSTPVDNAAVDLTILNGEWFASAGGGSLHYHIRYRVVTLDLS